MMSVTDPTFDHYLFALCFKFILLFSVSFLRIVFIFARLVNIGRFPPYCKNTKLPQTSIGLLVGAHKYQLLK